VLSGETTNTNFIVFGLNHYTTDAVPLFKVSLYVSMRDVFIKFYFSSLYRFHFCLLYYFWFFSSLVFLVCFSSIRLKTVWMKTMMKIHVQRNKMKLWDNNVTNVKSCLVHHDSYKHLNDCDWFIYLDTRLKLKLKWSKDNTCTSFK
jgi:hypothetical protein